MVASKRLLSCQIRPGRLGEEGVQAWVWKLFQLGSSKPSEYAFPLQRIAVIGAGAGSPGGLLAIKAMAWTRVCRFA